MILGRASARSSQDSVTHITDAGRVPKTSDTKINWREKDLNTFRANAQGKLDALGIPDLTVSGKVNNAIGSDCGGIPEIITPGETGLLVPKGEPEPLGRALLRLIEDRAYAARLAHNALEHVQAYHTIDMMGDKILAVYGALLQNDDGLSSLFRSRHRHKDCGTRF